MRIDIISCVPKLLDSPFNQSIVHRAQEKGLVEVHIHDLRDHAVGNYRQVDDYAYGGGAGMVLTPGPLSRCIEQLQGQRKYDEVIYTTPDGKVFDQREANRLSLIGNIMIICGHYKGIDQRIRDQYVTLELSIGDFVLSGGELAAAVIADALIRLIPGVISDETSALSDSFQDDMLAPPVYTRPAEFNGMKVPDVLLSGHEAAIDNWRHEQAMERTKVQVGS